MHKTRFGLNCRRFLTAVVTQLTLILSATAFIPRAAMAQNAFVQSNLISSVPGLATDTDTNLINPWGLTFSATSPFWVSDAGTGLSTVYTAAPSVSSTVVTVPPAAGQTGPSLPTGIIANSAAGFEGTGTAMAHFIFSTENGTISAWSSGASAVLKVDYSTSNAVFKGLAAGSSGGTNFIYASDFHNGQIDVFNSNYSQVTLAGSFSDPSLLPGFAPFNIQNINGELFVTYALQDGAGYNDVGGPGNGYVDIFSTSGILLQRLVTQGVLNSPWGVAVAPPGFGPFAGDVLVGNFRDGTINAFDPLSGEWLGALADTNGAPISVIGLWAIAFGNGHDSANPQSLYFTAGINGESAGLLASLTAQYPSPTNAAALYVQSNLVSDVPGLATLTDTNLVNPWGIAISATSPFWISDAGTGLSTLYTSAPSISSTVVTIPPAAGQTGPSSPTGIIANSAAGFEGTGTATAHFIFSTENGTISAWSSGTSAVLKVDYSTSYAVFKGLASGSSGGTNFIYASDFYNAQIDVFNSNYAQVTLPGAFIDPNIPAGYAPFNIQNIGGQMYVTYAMQDGSGYNDVGGPGHGYVDIFTTSGVLVSELIAESVLNSPWGVALAPVGFGAYGGDLLVGNFRDGRINVFNPTSGVWLGALMTNTSSAFEVPGLWAITFGNGHSGGDVHTLYFTAGINGQSEGLLGSVAAVTPTFTSLATSGTNLVLSWGGGGTGPFEVQQSTNLAGSNWVTVGTTTNSTFTISPTNANAFFRLINQE